MFRNLLSVLSVIIFASAVAGCSSHIVMYDGPAKNKSEISVVTTQYHYGEPKSVLHSVDGKMGNGNLYQVYTGLPSYNSKLDDSFEIELLPGIHTLLVSHLVRSEGYYYVGKPFLLTLDAKPGITYNLKANDKDGIDIIEMK